MSYFLIISSFHFSFPVPFRPFFHILRYGFIDAAIETLTQHVLYLEQLVEVFTGIFCSRFLVCCLCHSPCKN